MEKHISKLTAFIFLLVLIFFMFIPYPKTEFLDLKQLKADKEKYQQLLKEEELRIEKQKKIYLTGKFDPSKREDFSLIPVEYVLGGTKMYLRKETLDAFLQMAEKAREDKIDLKIASATRNFDYQNEIWAKKWSGATLVDGKNLSITIPDGLDRLKKILEYSAVPGTSRHHWGTDIDINGADVSYFESKKGKREYEWLTQNAPLFGFCQTYDLKGSARPTGYNEEKWHWSFMPLSRVFLEEYKNLIKLEDIKGFDGDEYVAGLNLINDYVLAINPSCV